MNPVLRNTLLFGAMAALLLATGFLQSWNVALTVLQMGLISAIMALGVNIQWGYAGLLNVGVMGFVAIGGLAAVLVAAPVDREALSAGGLGLVVALLAGAATIFAAIWAWRRLPKGSVRGLAVIAILAIGYSIYRSLFDPARDAVEAIEPALRGNIGGLGAPIMLAWPLGGVLAAGAAWVVGKTALGLRSDYLAIATLGISEIIIAILKNEDWLARGVKNVIGLPRPYPVPYEIDLQQDPAFVERAAGLGLDPVSASTLWVDVLYTAIFLAVLLVLLWLSQAALASPWGRMMRAIRDNETAAEAMGKDVTGRHLQVFILGSAVLGIAGAMMVTLDSQITPASYQPLRFTFLIWVMVIIGGSGNNFGAVLGGMLVWFLWVQVEALGPLVIDWATFWMGEGSALRAHLIDNAAQMRLLVMGVILLVVLRFFPRGLIPER
ncbi:MAG: branched-chain amino acid ABC transporter permease [Paracoccaceae bacterium]|nr:branched-chain amino acid ABC transporter permease [Paracoccaceae bacterium]